MVFRFPVSFRQCEEFPVCRSSRVDLRLYDFSFPLPFVLRRRRWKRLTPRLQTRNDVLTVPEPAEILWFFTPFTVTHCKRYSLYSLSEFFTYQMMGMSEIVLWRGWLCHSVVVYRLQCLLFRECQPREGSTPKSPPSGRFLCLHHFSDRYIWGTHENMCPRYWLVGIHGSGCNSKKNFMR